MVWYWIFCHMPWIPFPPHGTLPLVQWAFYRTRRKALLRHAQCLRVTQGVMGLSGSRRFTDKPHGHPLSGVARTPNSGRWSPQICKLPALPSPKPALSNFSLHDRRNLVLCASAWRDRDLLAMQPSSRAIVGRNFEIGDPTLLANFLALALSLHESSDSKCRSWLRTPHCNSLITFTPAIPQFVPGGNSACARITMGYGMSFSACVDTPETDYSFSCVTRLSPTEREH